MLLGSKHVFITLTNPVIMNKSVWFVIRIIETPMNKCYSIEITLHCSYHIFSKKNNVQMCAKYGLY